MTLTVARCPQDGRPFRIRPGFAWQVYCSGRCRVAAFRERQRATAAGNPGNDAAGKSPAGGAIEGRP